jgi:hypothetical protein
VNKKLWLAGGVLAVVGAVLWSRPAAASGGEVDDGDDATDDPEAAGGAAGRGVAAGAVHRAPRAAEGLRYAHPR